MKQKSTSQIALYDPAKGYSTASLGISNRRLYAQVHHCSRHPITGE